MNSLQFTVQQTTVRMSAQETLSATVPTPAVILLHGAGGNLDFWTARLSPYLQGAGISLYAPHYFDRTGTVRADLAAITDRRNTDAWLETVAEAIHFVAQRPGVDRNRLVLAGVSLGAFLALAHAAQQSARKTDGPRIRALIAVSGGLVPPFDTLATERFPPTLILHGAKDPIVPVTYAQALDSRLTELEVAHRTELFPNEGHWFSGAVLLRMLMAVSSFLQEHLQQQPPQNMRM